MNNFVEHIKRIFIRDGKDIQFNDFKDTELYYSLACDEKKRKSNSQAILDLDLNEVFYRINRTISCIGRQYFYFHFISRVGDKEEINNIEKAISYLENNSKNRDKLTQILKKSSNNKSLQIPYLFLGSSIPKDEYRYIYYLLSASALTSLIISIFNPAFLLIFIFLSIFNIIIHYLNKRRLMVYSDSLSQLERIYTANKKIQSLDIDFLDNEKITTI